jgi:hypothetical protein
MADDDTGPAVGVEARAGAVQLASPVCAPYHSGEPGERHTNQQVPSEARSAIVMLPLPSVTMATLTVDALAEVPDTKVREGSDAASVERSREPYPPWLAAAESAAVRPVDSACWAWRPFAAATPGALLMLVFELLPDFSTEPRRRALRRATPSRLRTVATIEKPRSSARESLCAPIRCCIVPSASTVRYLQKMLMQSVVERLPMVVEASPVPLCT